MLFHRDLEGVRLMTNQKRVRKERLVKRLQNQLDRFVRNNRLNLIERGEKALAEAKKGL